MNRVESYSPDHKRQENFSEVMQNEVELQYFYLFDYQNPFRLAPEEFQLISKAFWTRKPSNLNSRQEP